MNVRHYDLLEFMKEAKESKAKEVRVQRMQNRIFVGGSSYNNYQIVVGTKLNIGLVMGYVESLKSVPDTETRRNNAAKKEAIDREQVIRDMLVKEGFSVKKGAYKKNGGD